MAEIFIPPYQQFFSSNTEEPELLAGSMLYFYDEGTTTARTVYQNAALTTQHAQPVVADSAGRFAPIYLPVGNYKVVHKDSDGNTLWTADNVPGKAAAAANLTSALPDTPVLSKTAHYTVLAADMGSILNCDPTGGAITITLISAVTATDGAHITVKHAGTANNVTVSTVSSQTMDGVTSWVLREQYAFVTLVSNGANWVVKDHSYGNGVLSLFQQTAAPTGWTKSTTHNDKALRIVSGTVSTGGSTAFSSVFAARTVAQANLPSVNLSHSLATETTVTAVSYSPSTTLASGGGAFTALNNSTSVSVSTGTRAVSGTVSLGGSGTAMDFAVNYVDVILASKAA